MISLVEPVAGLPLFQVKITLKESRPPIWRRVIVRSDMRLHRFHQVIQRVMGWTNSHLHQFIVGKVFYGIPDPEFSGFGSETLNEKRYTIAELAPAAKAKFLYEYDFGDGWNHELIVEKLLPPDRSFKHAVCVAGAMACPPEDSGGIFGYYQKLEVLADPSHAEHADIAGWMGSDWNPNAFDLDQANRALKRIKA